MRNKTCFRFEPAVGHCASSGIARRITYRLPGFLAARLEVKQPLFYVGRLATAVV